QKLLHRLKATGVLPRISDRLGELTRTNSEAILGAERLRRSGADYSTGVAVTSSFHPTDQTHIEPVLSGKGSNAMAGRRTALGHGSRPGERNIPRWVKFGGEVVRRPWELIRLVNVRHWSERMVIALVMQVRDNSITLRPNRGPFGWGLRATAGHG